MGDSESERGTHSCGSGGNGVIPLGRGARRASIFDRIADVVFNEEQKEQNPVDAVAIRSVRIKYFSASMISYNPPVILGWFVPMHACMR